MSLKRILVSLLVLLGVLICLIYLPVGLALGILAISVAFAYSVRRLNHFISVDTAPPELLGELARNFDYLLLGSTGTWQLRGTPTLKNCKNFMALARPFSNLWADFLVLQRMHSYLRENGSVVVLVEISEQVGLSGRELNYADLRYLHPVTLASLGYGFTSPMAARPVVYFPWFSLRYLWSRVQVWFKVSSKLLRGFAAGPRGVDSLSARDANEIETLLGQFHDFCHGRNLKLRVMFIGLENDLKSNILKVIASLRARYRDSDWDLLAEASELSFHLEHGLVAPE